MYCLIYNIYGPISHIYSPIYIFYSPIFDIYGHFDNMVLFTTIMVPFTVKRQS